MPPRDPRILIVSASIGGGQLHRGRARRGAVPGGTEPQRTRTQDNGGAAARPAARPRERRHGIGDGHAAAAAVPAATGMRGAARRPRQLAAMLALLLGLASWGVRAQAPPSLPTPPAAAPSPIATTGQGAELTDVLVVGSQPEAIMAAVAAAQQGARTVLLTREARLGGLYVLGELNVLDLRSDPQLLQRGLFLSWWRRVGQRPAFDTGAAEKAFAAMLAQAGVRVVHASQTAVPLLDADGRLLGARAGDQTLLAKQVIDGEADGGFAAAAGAPFTIGWQALNVDQRMADTLVFALNGIDWPALTRAVRARGAGYAHVRDNVVWGPFGGYPAAYRPQRPGLRLRGLNLGRESDGTVLVNALLVYGADPLDAASRRAARQRAAAEVPAIAAYLARGIPGFEHARVAGVAPRLYVRESRHLDAACVLHASDVLDNRVTDQAVAAGGYPLDVQSLTLHDSGFVFGMPDVYGARLCMAVAPTPAPLWVVGKTAGFDPIAFASARVVPFGMALGEAVGVAAARAARLHLDPAALASDPRQVAAVRSTLAARGAYLPPVEARPPVGPVSSPYFDDFRLLLGRGLAVGGYANDPHLQAPLTQQSFLYLLSNVAQRFFDDGRVGPALVARYGDAGGPLRPAIALSAAYDAACQLGACPAEPTWTALQRSGIAPAGFAPAAPLDRGQAYALAAGVARLAHAPPPR